MTTPNNQEEMRKEKENQMCPKCGGYKPPLNVATSYAGKFCDCENGNNQKSAPRVVIQAETWKIVSSPDSKKCEVCPCGCKTSNIECKCTPLNCRHLVIPSPSVEEDWEKEFDNLGITFSSDINRSICKQFINRILTQAHAEAIEAMFEVKKKAIAEATTKERERWVKLIQDFKSANTENNMLSIGEKFAINSELEGILTESTKDHE